MSISIKKEPEEAATPHKRVVRPVAGEVVKSGKVRDRRNAEYQVYEADPRRRAAENHKYTLRIMGKSAPEWVKNIALPHIPEMKEIQMWYKKYCPAKKKPAQ